MPQSIDHIFKKLQPQRQYTISCSFIQIYKEKVFDLLNPIQFIDKSLALGMKFNDYNENLYSFVCKSKEDVKELYQFGVNNCVVGCNRLGHILDKCNNILSISVESFDLSSGVRVDVSVG